MDFILLLILAGGLIYLWRRFDELESRLSYFEQLVDSQREPAAQPDMPVRQAAPNAIPATRSVTAQETSDRPLEYVEPTIAAVETPAYVEPEPEPLESEKAKWRPNFDFEDIFGRLLPIWAGGITLAVAGFFLVRWSIDNGLLGPQVRVALGFLFGAGLLGAAEIAFRQERRIADPRVRQALAGAGLATLYASFYLAGSLYGLIGTTIAFLGLAGVTGSAIVLSFRFGLPAAILGLVGGFAAPMLVGGEEANLPVLALYLALVTGGLTYAGNRQGRSWLALGALAGGLGWAFLLLFSGVSGTGDVVALGGYLVVIGALIPAFTDGREAAPWFQLGAAALAAVQMAAMVEMTDFSMLAWGLFGLLTAALAFFAWPDSRLRPTSAFAAAVAAAMLAMWSDAAQWEFAIVGIGLTAIIAGVPLANIWREHHGRFDVYQLGAFALALIAITYGHFAWEGSQNILALICLGIAMLPALGAYLLWPKRDEPVREGIVVTLVSAAIGVSIAGLIATPLWAAPLVLASVALGVIGLCWKRDDKALLAVMWSGALATLVALLPGPGFLEEAPHLFGIAADIDQAKATIRWLTAALPFVALAIHARNVLSTACAEVLGVLVLYGMVAQIVPGDLLAWSAALAAVALAWLLPVRQAARLTAASLAFFWAAVPVMVWAAQAFFAAGSEPMMIADVIDFRTIGFQLLPAIVAGPSLLWRRPAVLVERMPVIEITLGAISMVAAHSVFKQTLAITSDEHFITFGLLERTVWQALLFGGGVAILRFAKAQRWAVPVAVSLALASLAHFAVFSFGWHNPVWDEQAVGGLPIFNLLLAAYGIAIAATLWLSAHLKGAFAPPRWIYDAVVMLLMLALALTELRQIFAGSILIGTPVGQSEDLIRSLIGIILAIGFLLWGARSQSRGWRIGSLVLMLLAVLKVFLFDANGLEGLVRVASFVALGFSLIGIGWFYARQLAPTKLAGR